ncbi:hypothetical protein UPYG_G00018870 [Umbra pygmaea]|uniref:Shroom2 n=1 Tax=Umbra pygmaea TaxID=75934 RepID=A0ABD0XND2_UMBPY
MKIMDIVSHTTMPSDTDMHVARNFLTKILRSSMRKNRFKGSNDTAYRPQSWQPSKFTEDHPKDTESQTKPAPVGQAKHEVSASTIDLSSCWDHNSNLRQLSSQFSSVGNMERVENPSLPYPSACLSTSRYHSSSEPHSEGGCSSGKRDSAFSCLSSNSPPPEVAEILAGPEGSMFYKGFQSQSFEGGRQSDQRHNRYLQLPQGSGGRESPRTVAQEQPGSRYSSSGPAHGDRSHTGPVWHVPDRRQAGAPPSPPPPPLRSDSFAATKVFPAYVEGPGAALHAQMKAQGREVDKLAEAPEKSSYRGPGHHIAPVPHSSEKGPEGRRTYIQPRNKDLVHPDVAAGTADQNQLNLPNKLFSLSSQDVRQTQLPNHMRQYSDESPFYLQTRSTPHPPKLQSVGSYYRSLQELPTNLFNRTQVKSSTASLSSSTVNHDSGGHIRYYCITTKQPAQPESRGRPSKADVWRADMELAKGGRDRFSISSYHKTNYLSPAPPQPQPPYPDSKERNGHFKLATSSTSSGKTTEDRARRTEGQRLSSEAHLGKSCSPSPPKDRKEALVRDDPWVYQDNHKIHPKKTPMLHSLTQDSRSLLERKAARAPSPSNSIGKTNQEAAPDCVAGGKMTRRSERYATTLRNEIQLKRAQLQKSRSAATLTCPRESEEQDDDTDPGVWRSNQTSSDGSFPSSYKDHLKEAQARVLQATSFKRRDLEPSGFEASLSKPNEHTVSRIGCRKRFPLNKRIHSFSEPDKINTLGVERGEKLGDAGSFVDRQKFFEMAANPAFSRPTPAIPKPGHQSSNTVEHGEGRARGKARLGDTEEGWRSGQATETSRDHCQDQLALQEQQRLGTFAEYQASWNMQKKASDTNTQGRYHSAENILDQGQETPACIHERSRSSPTADFNEKSTPVPWRDTVGNQYLDQRQEQDQGEGSTSREQLAQHFPQTLEHSIPGLTTSESHGSSHVVAPLPRPSDHTHKPDPAIPAHILPSYPSSHAHTHRSVPGQPPPPHAPRPQNTGVTVPQGPLLGASTTTSSCYGHSSLESLPGPGSRSHQTHPAEASSSSSSSLPGTELDPALKQDSSLGSTWRCSASIGINVGVDREEEEDRGADSALDPPCSPSQPSQAASPVVASSKWTRCPSPQFGPQWLTNQPPVSLATQDEAQPRNDTVMETSSVARKVPVKIVHAENTAERESCLYLQNSDPEQASGGSEGCKPSQHQPTSLPSHEPQPYSLFCAYLPQDPPRVPTPTITTEEALAPGQSQTNGTSSTSSSDPQPRSHLEEDVKRAELARDIMDKDRSLADILDQSKMKTTMDLMEGIFPQGEHILEEALQRRKVSPKHSLPPRTSVEREGLSAGAVGSLVTSSSYYSVSAPKAELLNMMKDMQDDELGELEHDSEDELDLNLASKKQELIDSLGKKLQVLREARESLQEDVHDNNSLGDEVEATVQRVCRPNELDKFKMFVGDLDKVVSLLLSLSGRLARVENALNSLEEDTPPEEKRTLTEKRKLLIRQHEDAKELKENLDRRERLVYTIMAAHLCGDSLADYQHFVKMKSALIIEQRKLDDKIKLGEEQLKCLLDSLPLEQRLLF